MRPRSGPGCGEDWRAMAPAADGRHCARCDRDVVDLTVLTRRRAEDAIRARGGRLCVRMSLDARGAPVFQPEPRRAPRLTTLALASALLGCEPGAPPIEAAATIEEPLDASQDVGASEPGPLAVESAPMIPIELGGPGAPLPVPAIAPPPEIDATSGPTDEQRALTRRKRRALAAAAQPAAPVPPPSQAWMGDYYE